MSILLLGLYFGILGVCARDAFLDRTPRKPFDWRRPDLEWWAHRRTKRERGRGELSL